MLLVLRFLSALVLLGILIALFIFLWRDYQQAVVQTHVVKRHYGQLLVLAETDGMFIKTGEVYPLRALTSMGRAPTNSIIIDDHFASSEHATISLRDGRWWLEDRHSRNGTLLNSDRVLSATIITDGDIISIGTSHFKLGLDS